MEEETEPVPQSIGRPAGKRRTRWMIGCASVAALALVALLVLVVLGQQQAARVKHAIEATMPDYCWGAEERIRVHPKAGRFTYIGTYAPFPARQWHVTCRTTITCQPVVTVDVERCEVRVVTAFNGTYTETLKPCP